MSLVLFFAFTGVGFSLNRWYVNRPAHLCNFWFDLVPSWLLIFSQRSTNVHWTKLKILTEEITCQLVGTFSWYLVKEAIKSFSLGILSHQLALAFGSKFISFFEGSPIVAKFYYHTSFVSFMASNEICDAPEPHLLRRHVNHKKLIGSKLLRSKYESSPTRLLRVDSALEPGPWAWTRWN